MDRLHAGTESKGVHGWENGLGEPGGDQLEEVRHELEILLASTPRQTSLITGAAFDPEAFERIWKSEAVQRAASSYGWRGLADAVRAAAFHEVSRTCQRPRKTVCFAGNASTEIRSLPTG
ncbi:hypothetical protein CF68_20070 [Cupriavidus sp. SK-4]|nr:hypothetical protein CF68_20070 [Cupriavidus sp. SK-4]